MDYCVVAMHMSGYGFVGLLIFPWFCVYPFLKQQGSVLTETFKTAKEPKKTQQNHTPNICMAKHDDPYIQYESCNYITKAEHYSRAADSLITTCTTHGDQLGQNM
jgi:hypothetical protein